MPHAPDLSGRALDGRYELHAVIGEGTFGRVYRGRDRRLARPVAVKVIKPWWAEDPEWVLSFELEAQLLARVDDPGIVQIFDVGHAKEGLYYVAELVEGESLADRLRRGSLSATEAHGIAEQLCRALTRAHSQRVIHRDIKPANVLISVAGQVKVGDFGVARLAEGSTDGAGATIVGTPRYMAPEQARGGATSPATDVYSVGIVLYEMLAGQPPFMDRSAVELALRHLHDSPPPLPEGTPAELVEIVERALAKSSRARYPDAGAMADALARARCVVAADEARPAPEPRRVRLRGAGETPVGTATTSRTAPIRRGRRTRNPHAAEIKPASVPNPALSAIAETAPTAGARDATAATALLHRIPKDVAATRVQVPTIPLRDLNEGFDKARKRRRARLVAGVLLVFAVVAAALVIMSTVGHVKVPDLHGWRRASATARLRRLGLKPVFRARNSSAPAGSAVAQTPKPGTSVSVGATVRLVLSEGPPPIHVPALVGQPGGEARTHLAGLGLHSTLTPVAAPGVEAGLVTRESPAAGATLRPGSNVALLVAEQPRWRPLTSFSGRSSVPFRIRGTQWRVVYRMGYQGICTLIFFCSAPHARVLRPAGDSTLSEFDLGDGTGQAQVFKSAPGIYQISVTPGGDTAQWSMAVEDYY